PARSIIVRACLVLDRGPAAGRVLRTEHAGDHGDQRRRCGTTVGLEAESALGDPHGCRVRSRRGGDAHQTYYIPVFPMLKMIVTGKLSTYLAGFIATALIVGSIDWYAGWSVSVAKCPVPGDGQFLAVCNNDHFGDYEHGAHL